MANTRITANMNIKEILITMCDGNPGALTCMMQMLQSDPLALFDILFFDTMEIYGEKIYMLWNDCCGRDMTKFKETIEYLKSGKISKEKIHENLNRPYAVPFI
ncbi:MAG: hypothetical protein E7314_02915 [Clostridiales bacterium]|nr:hypothetical protein [Clostridiales bacterium]